VFGADEFELESDRRAELAAGEVPLGIGAGSVLRRAVVDRNARVGRGVRLVNAAGLAEARELGSGAPGGRGPPAHLPRGVEIREGILVVKRGAVIPDGTVV
jgi:glucose-1-phosphate adenylyltransferase